MKFGNSMNKKNAKGKSGILDTLVERYSNLKQFGDDIAKSNENYLLESVFLGMTLDYYESFYTARAKNTSIIMTNAGIPVEFSYAAGVFPLVQEMITNPLAGAGSQAHFTYIDFAEQSGLTSELCNNIKIWIGAMLLDETPSPDMIIYANFPCDSTTIEWQIIKNYYNVPTFSFDVPYWHYNEKDAFYDSKTLSYYGSQLKKMKIFIEKNANVTIPFERLKETFDLSNQARNYVLEVLELLRAKPCPLNSDISYTLYSTLLTYAGLPGTPIDYTRMVRDKAVHNFKNKISAISERYSGKEEKFRCFWTCMPVYFDPMFFSWMEEKFQISTVMNMIGSQIGQPVNLSNEDLLLTDVAKNILNAPMGRQLRGPLEFYLDDIIRTIKDYQVDFCIWGGHVSCKQAWGIANLLKQLIHEQTGIPTLMFEIDDLDNRIKSPRSIKKLIRDFVKNVFQK